MPTLITHLLLPGAKCTLSPQTVRATRVLSAFAAGAATVALFGTGSTANADATVVAQTTVAGGPTGMFGGGAAGAKPANHQATTTTYYKGHKIRAETNGTVVITDGDSGQAYSLNPTQKTYYSVADAKKSLGPMMAMMKMMKMTSSATVKQTGAKRTIAGHVTTEYAYTATIDMSMDPGAMPASARPSGNAAPMKPQHLGTMKLTGSYWVTQLASLPKGGEQSMRAASEQASDIFPGMKALTEKLSSIHGVALATQTSMFMQFGMPGMMPPTSNGAPKPMMNETTEATSVREGPLPDSLFTIPADYKKVQPPMPNRGVRRAPAQL
jgi:hypothetical protein